MTKTAIGMSVMGAFLTSLAACSSTPPPRWQEGGAPLVIEESRWDRDGDLIEITADGRIIEDGDHILSVDRAGRVVDEDNDPVAILLPTGQVAGPDDTALGHVGVTNASPPGSGTAWLSILPNGTVVRFDADGDREADGQWYGCGGASMRTCTLVTHVLAVRHYRRQPRTSVGVGIGIGF